MKRWPFVPLAIFGAILVTIGPAQADYIFTTITPPGAAPGDYVTGNGINDSGQALVAVGLYNGSYDATSVDDLYNVATRTYTALPAFPGAIANSTEAFAINDSGVMVGFYVPPGGYAQGFSYSNDVFSNVNAFGGNDTYPIDISNNGLIVGQVSDTALGTSQGYVDSNGQYTIVDGDPYPANSSIAVGINDSGEIILNSVPSNPSPNTSYCDSFLNVGGVNTAISMPGESITCASGINDAGAIVGTVSNDDYVTGSGFIDVGGVFTALDVPGATITYPTVINDSGQIVGSYIDANGNEQAFLATPASSPEPGTWAMILIGLAGVGIGRLRRGLQRGTVDPL
jgi:uncharacterized membrane protein